MEPTISREPSSVSDISSTTSEGRTSWPASIYAVPAALRERLDAQFDGEVILPGDEQYEELRHVHNRAYDRHPALIVRAKSAQDVAKAVRFALWEDKRIAVRSGRHSIAAYSTGDDAVVIDLGAMDRIEIDPVHKTARVQPGVTSGKLAPLAQEHGLALSTGDSATVGLGGLATGGGIGFMVRTLGLTIDSLISAEVVTADGGIVRTSAERHPDLFWAIRGGGGNFGIITEFEFQLSDVGTVYGGLLVLPATPQVIKAYADYALHAPESLTTIAMVMRAPEAPFIPAERVGEMVLGINIVNVGDVESGERIVAPLRALAEPVADLVSPIPYSAIYDYVPEFPDSPLSVRSVYGPEITEEFIADAIAMLEKAPGEIAAFQVRPLGGKMARVPEDATAFVHRDKNYLFAAITMTMGASTAEGITAWADEFFAPMRPMGTGVYVNFLQEEGEERVVEAYGRETYQRLRQVKRDWDPDNVFRLNQNIKPAR
jgi:FAD/FMN-containing dehydrogenase